MKLDSSSERLTPNTRLAGSGFVVARYGRPQAETFFRTDQIGLFVSSGQISLIFNSEADISNFAEVNTGICRFINCQTKYLVRGKAG